jgi:hypothetical protein
MVKQPHHILHNFCRADSSLAHPFLEAGKMLAFRPSEDLRGFEQYLLGSSLAETSQV